ncbi:MAG: peptidoglycan-binding domain-containing protein [bacterium]|nr:peptidoglycan-binding domain-containing protein [bacterium]
MNLRKIAVASALALTLALPVFAETATTTSAFDSLVATLQAQITSLKTQLETLRAARSSVVQSVQDVKGTLKLVRQLDEGVTSDQVRLLQTLLAADSAIYPEGILTGYYGKLTAQAVKRFQKKFGLEQVGRVGPKTLEKLNKELEKSNLKEEKDEDDDDGDNDRNDKKFCVPPGHLIAPGWLRKIEREGDDRRGGERGFGNIRNITLVMPCKSATSTPPVVTPTPTPTPTATPTPTPTATPTPTPTPTPTQ